VKLWTLALSALTLLVGQQEGYPVCKKTEWWGAGYLSGARCRLAHGPADAAATHCLLLQQNSRLVFQFWYRFIQVVPVKGPLNVYMYVCMYCGQNDLSKMVYVDMQPRKADA